MDLLTVIQLYLFFFLSYKKKQMMRFLFKNRKKGYIITFKRIADYMCIF